MSTTKGAPAAWLAAHMDFDGEECLIWPFCRTGKGYGRIWMNGRNIKVHRIICERRNGPSPTPKHETSHSCGRGHLGCVNGSHLRWATSKENAADKLIHGTHNRGERCNTAKLTEADVIAIRATFGIPHSKIAARYGVSRSRICEIIARKSWAWLIGEGKEGEKDAH